MAFGNALQGPKKHPLADQGWLSGSQALLKSSPGETLETPQSEKKCMKSVPAAHLVNTGEFRGEFRWQACEFREFRGHPLGV